MSILKGGKKKKKRKKKGPSSSFSKDPYKGKRSAKSSKAGSKSGKRKKTSGSTTSSRPTRTAGSVTTSAAARRKKEKGKSGSVAGSAKGSDTRETETPSAFGTVRVPHSKKRKKKNGSGKSGTEAKAYTPCMTPGGPATPTSPVLSTSVSPPGSSASRNKKGGSELKSQEGSDVGSLYSDDPAQSQKKANGRLYSPTVHPFKSSTKASSRGGSDSESSGDEKNEEVAGLLTLGQNAADDAQAAVEPQESAMEKIASILGDKVDNLSDADSDIMEGALNAIDDETELDAEGRKKAVEAYGQLMDAMKGIKKNLDALNTCQSKLIEVREQILEKTDNVNTLTQKAEDLRIAIAFNKTDLEQVKPQLIKDPRTWSVEDVGVWIANLRRKYRQYAKLFTRANINGKQLWRMTDDILEDTLGIEDDTHRMGIMRKVELLQDPKLLAALRPPTPEGSVRPGTILGDELDEDSLSESDLKSPTPGSESDES